MYEKPKNEPVRVNTRISKRANEWLDRKSAEMSMSKSALINVAIENYIKEMDVVQYMPEIMDELRKQGINIGS